MNESFKEEFTKLANMTDLVTQAIENGTTATNSPGLEKLMSIIRGIESRKPLHPGKNPETKTKYLFND